MKSKVLFKNIFYDYFLIGGGLSLLILPLLWNQKNLLMETAPIQGYLFLMFGMSHFGA